MIKRLFMYTCLLGFFILPRNVRKHLQPCSGMDETEEDSLYAKYARSFGLCMYKYTQRN